MQALQNDILASCNIVMSHHTSNSHNIIKPAKTNNYHNVKTYVVTVHHLANS